MVKPAVVVLLVTGCAHPEAPPVAPAQPAGRPVVAAPRPAPSLHTERPPVALGGSPTWATVDADAIKFCPGDEELVATESHAVRRYRVRDGALLATTPLDEPQRSGRYDIVADCRADGSALALDADRTPVLVDSTGKVIRPPAPFAAQRAVFAEDGAVLALDETGVTRWQGDRVELVIPAREHALYQGLGEGGAYVERIYQPGKPADGLWLTRGGVRIKLPGNVDEIEQLVAAPDGGIAIAGDMAAWAWTVKGKVASKQTLLLDQSGTHVSGIAATNRFFIVGDAGSNIWSALRPKLTWDHLDKPCGEGSYQGGIAMAHDDKRLAVACPEVGIRIFDVLTGRQVSRPLISSAAVRLVWSPTGDRLATRAANGTIRVWRGPALQTTIEGHYDTSLWWASDTELAGTEMGSLGTWTLADGEAHEVIPKLATGHVEHSAHGELMYADPSGGERMAIVLGDHKRSFALPPIKQSWIPGFAISDGGGHAIVLRSESNSKVASELITIDVATDQLRVEHVPVSAAALDDEATYVGAPSGELSRHAATTQPIGHHPTAITAVAVSRGIVAAGGEDGAISLWTTAGVSLGTLTGHSSQISALAWSPDGARLASTAPDGTKIWSLR